MKSTWIALAAAALLAPAAARAEGEVFGLSIAMAPSARDHAWIEAQIQAANELFAPSGTRFRWLYDKALPETHAALHGPADRDALAAYTEPRGVIDVFVVSVLEDIDEPGRLRKGVAWTHRPDGRRYVVVVRGAPPQVLAHELGHFFGNPHSVDADNLMSYERTGGPVGFDAAQNGRIRGFSKRFLDFGRLWDVGVPRLLP